MKQRDHLAVASSSLSLNASESDPDDSFWSDFTFDFSFLTSDDHKTGGLGDDTDSNNAAVPKKSEELFFDSNVKEHSPPPIASSVAKGKEACLRDESSFSPLFAKISALRIKECSVDDTTEVDSPCWKGAVSPSSSLNMRRSRDDLNVLYGLNPMAPQFIPSSNANSNGKEFGGNGSPSLKRSLSSTFPPSSGEFSINNLYEAGSDQTNRTCIMNHDADESLGLVCQDSSNQFQRRTKLDPLAPVFVPAYAHSAYASSEVGHIGSVNHRLGSQVQKKKLNPLAPQFSLADTTKPKVYAPVENQAANDLLPNNVNSSVLFSPVTYKEIHAGLTHPSVHVEPSYKDVDTKQMGRHRSPQMDVKKLLTTIHGLSELLTHVHGSGSPNEQDLALINSTVQNLNSYINNRVHDGLASLPNMCKQSIREHQIPKARNLNSTVDSRRKEKYPMVVKGETGAEPQVEYIVTKENGFGQVVRNHETEEQINPQALFYKSLWLKARADRSLMEYETFLSSSRT